MCGARVRSVINPFKSYANSGTESGLRESTHGGMEVRHEKSDAQCGASKRKNECTRCDVEMHETTTVPVSIINCLDERVVTEQNRFLNTESLMNMSLSWTPQSR